MKSVRAKAERLLADEFANTNKRVELIHHDCLLINLPSNAHASHYELTDEGSLQFMTQSMKLKLQHLPRMQCNDPLLLYYGIPEQSVVT